MNTRSGWGIMLLLAALPLAQSMAAIPAGDTVAIDFGANAPATAHYNHVPYPGTASWTVPGLSRLSDGADTGINLEVVMNGAADRNNTGFVAGNGGSSDSTICTDAISTWTGSGGANNNSITLTFTGLHDAQTYSIVGGASRSDQYTTSFSTDWTIGGTTLHSDCTVANGYVNFTNLTSSGGQLIVTISDPAYRVTVAQLELTAVGDPGPIPEPDKPTQLSAMDGYTDEMLLDWADNNQAGFSHFIVKRSQDAGGPYTPISGATPSVSAYTDSGLTTGVTYYYVVSAVNADGLESVDSSQVSGAPVPFPNPDVPRQLSATNGYDNEIVLDWADNDQDGFSYFVVKRSQHSGGPFVPIAGATPSASAYIDSGLTAGVTYYYVISSVNMDAVESIDSLQVSATAQVYVSDIERPNVIMIYYDDMGYSDFGAYDTSQPSLTPKLDTFAAQALRFTAGHSADTVCTPSRYALITGRYCWRTSLKNGVTSAYNKPLIEDDRFTFAKMFKSLGYKTAMIGKWHIGMQFYSPTGEPVDYGNISTALDNDHTTTSGDLIDFSRTLTSTPYHHGFDYFFGTSASLDMPPYTWIENDTVLFKGGFVDNGAVDFSQGVPASNGDLREGGGANITRPGVYDPNFVVADYLQVQAQKVADLIAERAVDGAPFFLYIPVPAPHTPWAVQDAFNNSASYTYGKYLAQTDYYTGVILDALDDPDGNPATDDSLAHNTVVFISSDNGPEKRSQADSLAAGRDGNGPFRGVKRDNWEGGTRVPFLVRWPGMVAPGTTDHACWQGDFFASMAAYLGYDFEHDEAPDSESMLPILLGNNMPDARREGMIQHSYAGQLAIVDKTGEWKLLDGTGSGGYSDTYDADNVLVSSVGGTIRGEPKQLFNLLTDPGERSNLLAVPSPSQANLDKAAELYALLNEIRGNTTSGTDGDSMVPPPDNDQDGMPNAFENTFEGLDRNDPTDGGGDLEPDGLTNLEEFQYGANPHRSDSDDDRLPDYDEVHFYGTLAGNAHSDTDTLEDGDEILIWGTNPLVADTDGDGTDDDDELALFSSPLNPTSVPELGEPMEIVLNISESQLAGYNGTALESAVAGGTSSGWAEAGDLFVRERFTSSTQQKTQLFIRFDLSDVSGVLTDARLRIHQHNRLNDQYSSDLQLARVTEAWGTSPGNYPVFEGTGVTDAFVFGNSADFGTDVDASGFFSGTAGTPGTDDGFDVTSLVQAWFDGDQPNYGFRVSMTDPTYAASAFSEIDDLATPSANEQLQLILTVRTGNVSADRDGDGLLDAYEMRVYGDLTTAAGTDDGDQDGMNTLVEQVLGSNPTSNASLPLVEMVTANSAEVALAFHRYNRAGVGVEVLISEDLVSWEPYTKYYEYAAPAPASELGSDYDKVQLKPHSALPAKLFYKLNVHTL